MKCLDCDLKMSYCVYCEDWLCYECEGVLVLTNEEFCSNCGETDEKF